MKEFHVMIGGRERRLRFTSRDGITAKKVLGKTLWAALREAQEGDMEILALLLQLGLQHDDPSINEKALLGIDDQPGLIAQAMETDEKALLSLWFTCLNAADYACMLGLNRRGLDLKVSSPGKAEAPPAAIPAAS